MQKAPIKTEKYLNTTEIQKHLENVEYIIMAEPAPDFFQQTPIHFTIFLNTPQPLPEDIKDAVLDKFREENGIEEPKEVMSQIMPVGFAISKAQETPMPMLLVKPEDQKSIPYGVMHVIDFLADSQMFEEVKNKQLTGWTYSYTN